ncbi:ABC transporter ATP-binding protein [Propionibacterium acidifaciens]|uniref:ABC transporter ATP-binding protein n=1 Tax=Propionibacterium acidifaciens TaxID=556499 RepID=UPI0023F24FD3|nr:ABC transporter ATP-binding protein [Propionibacterium acidifaciens]
MDPMARRPTVLRISNLAKKYGDRTIVSRFSLDVHEGEAVALTGRNGSGKSTILRCIVGSDRPTEGAVEVLGVKAKDTDPQFRRNVATVIDDLDFFPDLSVVEHLDLLARAHGLDDTDELVDAVLEEVQLVPQSGQLPGTLSSGQRRRLALATAFVRPKRLLVLDEPEQRLDVEGIDWLGKRLRHERDDNGLAIIMASHEPSLVEAVGARIVRVGAAGSASQSLAEPEQLV